MEPLCPAFRFALLAALFVSATTPALAQPDFGHKVLGGIGIQAQRSRILRALTRQLSVGCTLGRSDHPGVPCPMAETLPFVDLAQQKLSKSSDNRYSQG